MSGERIRKLLEELDKELKETGDLDTGTRRLLARLNDDLDAIAAGEDSAARSSARELESRFAATHPVAERITREIADILAKMGI